MNNGFEMENQVLNKNYTLEKHLRFLSSSDKDYELLYSIWDLNKKNLSQGLNLVSNSFPHYSAHDISHSMTIINNIQCFLGEERIKHLGATDTFLILMSCLTHDIGMVLTYKIIEEEWQKENFRAVLENLAQSEDSVISRNAKLLLSYKETLENQKPDNFKWALEIKNAVIVLTAEIFRSKHAKQSANYLLSNQEFKRLADNFYSEQLPNRFIELLANIALLHGENFCDVMTRLYPKANGYKGDYIHPRFIACMIRLGDLLDFDDNRFNTFSIASIKDMPEVSALHQQKHASVRHMLISPTAIEAELDCSEENVYRIARSWFDWLEEEVNNQSREWSNIAPPDLGGLPPIISKNSIRILYKGIQASSDLLNLKFTMSQKKMFSILRGGGIYKEPGFAFIREIVQNAFDASKLQMWSDINNGIYDSYFESEGNDKNSIQFPDDINPTVYKQYPVDLSIKWLDEERNVLHIECEDRGTGISETTLLRMTKYVGESYSNDYGYAENYKKMPYWLRPTAAFGIGLQSIFFVSSTFEVETAFPGEKSKRIIFRSAADNQYCSIVEENIKNRRGTIIKVDIQKEKFSELFGNSFSWDILGSVDVFKNDGDDLYLAKIDDFVKKTFEHVSNSCFNYYTVNQDRCFKRGIISESPTDISIKGKYKYSFEYVDGFLIFKFYEKEYGSSFYIWFNQSLKDQHRLPQRLLLRDVLVSNAKLSYWKTGYLGFEWNLNNQTTDKIVDLSRDNLTYIGRQWVTNTLLEKILPESISLIKDVFNKELEQNNSKAVSLDIQYLNFCLTAFACRTNTYNVPYLSKIKLPSDIASCNKSPITADKLFEAETLFLVKGFKTVDINSLISLSDKERIENENEKILNDQIVIWGDNYLYNALMFNYICVKNIRYELGCKIYELKKRDINPITPQLIDYDVNYLLKLEEGSFHNCSRNAIYGLKKYEDITVKMNWISGFENFPNYGTCCIYSPFSKKEQIDQLLDSVKDMSEQDIKNYIQTHISEYITSYMMKMVKLYNIHTDITDEQIKTAYISLIYDYVMLKTQYQKM